MIPVFETLLILIHIVAVLLFLSSLPFEPWLFFVYLILLLIAAISIMEIYSLEAIILLEARFYYPWIPCIPLSSDSP